MRKYMINTQHLGMRLIKHGDERYLAEIDKDAEVKRFYPEGTLTDAQITDFINESLNNYQQKHLPCFVVFKARTSEFVGEAYFDQLKTGEIKVGYLIHKKFWNKGYGSELLKALLNWAKINIDSDYIIAFADKNNEGSFRVMEKSGMKYYKTAEYLDMDCHFYRKKNK